MAVTRAGGHCVPRGGPQGVPKVPYLSLTDIKESENIASLHNQITACDAILEVRREPGGGVPKVSPRRPRGVP